MEPTQVGKQWGFEDDREATVYPVTPEELARRRQATSGTMMAFELEGLFDEDEDVAVWVAPDAEIAIDDEEDEGDDDADQTV